MFADSELEFNDLYFRLLPFPYKLMSSKSNLNRKGCKTDKHWFMATSLFTVEYLSHLKILTLGKPRIIKDI